ncbi:MAG: nucleotidyltransferase family protein [Cohaesibacteraceae bacterium]|nr:nucleotidyltransferase family protein [Cohaesibacteraceae bacterium]
MTEIALATRVRQIVLADSDLAKILNILRDAGLPDWRLVSGAIYQTIWNDLTGKPQGTGIKDYDVAYFDDSDISYEAEDRQIKRIDALLPDYPGKIEVRNQARVHLWFKKRFGVSYPQLSCSDNSLDYYMCPTHAIAVRLELDDTLSIAAPFGLEDIFNMLVRPNPMRLGSRNAYEEKADRMKQVWPELTIQPWIDQIVV